MVVVLVTAISSSIDRGPSHSVYIKILFPLLLIYLLTIENARIYLQPFGTFLIKTLTAEHEVRVGRNALGSLKALETSILLLQVNR